MEEYTGRMVADGSGNLLADEGDHAGEPIAYDESRDGFFFVKPGEPSHNARHHEQFVGVVVTQDQQPDMPGYAGTADNPTEGHEHHFGVLPDDLHYEEGATDGDGKVTNVRAPQLPDKVSAKISGHTHQHKVGA